MKLTRPRTRKATIHTLNSLGIQFFDANRISLIHGPSGERIFGWQYDCEHLTQSQKDSLQAYGNIVLGTHKHQYAPEITNPIVFLADKNIPLECRAIV